MTKGSFHGKLTQAHLVNSFFTIERQCRIREAHNFSLSQKIDNFKALLVHHVTMLEQGEQRAGSLENRLDSMVTSTDDLFHLLKEGHAAFLKIHKDLLFCLNALWLLM